MNTEHLKQQVETLKAKQDAANERLKAAQLAQEQAEKELQDLGAEQSRTELALRIISGEIPLEEVEALLTKKRGKVIDLAARQGGSGSSKKVAGRNVGALPASGKTKKGKKKAAKKSAKLSTATETPAKPTKKVPVLRERLKIIMGEKATKVDDIIKGLNARKGWTPTSKNLKAYIGAELSASDEFVNVARGIYAVVGTEGVNYKPEEKKAAAPSKKKAAPKKTTTKGKAEMKPKATKPATKKKPEASTSKVISDNRKAVAEGKLPPLRIRMAIVMGKEEMKIQKVLERLEAHGGDWMPNAKDPSTYLSMTFNADKKMPPEKRLFEKVSRGVFKVVGDLSEIQKSAHTQTNKKQSKSKEETMSNEQMDAELEKLGTDGNMSNNPFSG